MSKGKIRIGPAGWSYKDWEGIVYPRKSGAKFDPLEYLARFFDTIEINSSFYRPFTVSTANSWARRTAEATDFLFTAKLHRVFTHERGKATEAEEKAVREGFDALAGEGKLGAVLIQFPWSFKNTDDERVYLMKLLERFREYPLALEVRHLSWNTHRIYEWLEELGVGICNIDQPLFTKSVKPAALTTSQVGYVRLHGRNYQDWFREKAPRDDRYNYLYSLDELEPWITRIKEIAAKTKESYVITNNHFRGQAVVNALEIKSTLTEQLVPAPAPLFQKYPALIDSAIPETAESEAEPTLFS
ncbi:MAG: DUF72 domain-containing protein [Acidobacteriota bacterium]|nr:DUF72 domain-containing protein [Acidobacteriota bacterium]